MPIKEGDLDYSKVIESIKKKEPTLAPLLDDREKLSKVLTSLRRHSFFVSKLNKISQVKYIQNSLAEAIEEGQTFQQWKETVRDEQTGIFDTLQKISRSRLETVYRTNVAQATEDGTIERAIELGDFVIYSAVNDSRTRPSHAALDGLTLPATDPRVNELRTPLDFGCRCSWIPASRRSTSKTDARKVRKQLEEFDNAGGSPASFAKNTTQDAAAIRRYLNRRAKSVGIESQEVRELEKRNQSEFDRHTAKVLENISGE